MVKQVGPYLPIYTIHQDPTRPFQPLGLVVQHKTEGMGVIRDLVARFKDFTGGRVGSYDRSVHADLIYPTLRELCNQARDTYTVDGVGPDAIVGLVMDVKPAPSNDMAMMQIIAYGTAVRYLTEEEEAAMKQEETSLRVVLRALVEAIREFIDEIRRWFRGDRARADPLDQATIM